MAWSVAASIVTAGLAFGQAGPTRDTMPDTWAATDALGRRIDPAIYPAARPGRTVAAFYFLWMQGGSKDRVYDISKILAGDADDSAGILGPAWGPKHAFHWWARPYLGYYRSDDERVIATHAQQLCDAGVDLVVFDVTNAVTYDATLTRVLDTYTKLRAAGRPTPKFAFLIHSKNVATARHLYDTLYKPGRYRDLWFRWKGKPLLMGTPTGLGSELTAFFGLRDSWAWSSPTGWFKDGRHKWPWLDNWPQAYGWADDPKTPEASSVSVAGHPTTGVGRSMTNRQQPPPAAQTPLPGLQFAEQWTRALEIDPEFLFVTGWNEWIAQRFEVKPGQTQRCGDAVVTEGGSFFVDQYTLEYSRDIEPMAGGYGDNYYYQLADGVRRYKGVRPLPPFSGPTTIDLAAGFAQWQGVTPEYRDDRGDAAHRDAAGYGDAGRQVNASGRNDIEACHVTYDAANVYFHVRTAADLTPPSATNWMTLLIDRPGDAEAGWAGYDLAVNRTKPDAGETTVEHWRDGRWTPAGRARVVFKGRDLHVAVPRTLVGDVANGFDFKWTDNGPVGGDPMAFIDQGDAAPSGRFNYRFRPDAK